ncbi:MAG: sulfurtransferase-like selenium metabolism protein YedF [Desulfobacterales bacterium]|nr:sulfurtransferase-like selenium metabolism protein YedF [Desulfobacterales bacterium]
MSILDFKGLNCPQPVIRTKTFLEENPCRELTVRVDNRAAVENVTRFLQSQGFSVECGGQNPLFTLSASRKEEEVEVGPTPALLQPGAETASTVVMITHNTMGTGDLVLGEKLMVNFLKTLPEMGDALWTVIMVNEGVKLASDRSAACEELVALEAKGVRLLVCGTCLEHFGLMSEKRVGETTNMLDIVTTLQVASKVINI